MVLLDTQIVLWMALEPERVPAKFAKAMIQAQKHGALSIAGISLWEIALLNDKGRVQIDPLWVFLRKVESVYKVLPMNGDIAIRSTQFSKRYPADPADRQIGATAIVHGLTLLTADSKILKSKEVPCLL